MTRLWAWFRRLFRRAPPPHNDDLVSPGAWPALEALVRHQPPRGSWRDEAPESDPFI